MLRENMQPHNSVALCKFFSAGGQGDSGEETLTKRVIERLLRIHGRCTATPGTTQALDLLEAFFGANHALAGTHCLDTLAGKTSCKTPAIMNAAFEWIVQGYAVGMLRGTVPRKAGEEYMRTKFFPLMLLLLFYYST